MLAAVNERGANFRRVIKMLKDWNRRQTVRLQSYHIEVIALDMSSSWTDHSWPIYQWFVAAQPATQFCWHGGQDVSGYLTPERAVRVRGQLETAGHLAQQAWYNGHSGKHREAVTLWKSVFGQRFPSYG